MGRKAGIGGGGVANRGHGSSRSVVSLFRSVLDDVVCAFVPGECRVCGLALEGASEVPVCAGCRAASAPQTGVMCVRCGEAMGLDTVRFAPAEGILCTPCRRVSPDFERAVAYGVYEDHLRTMLHLLKYERMQPIAGVLGGLLAESVLSLRAATAERLLVAPVPLFAAKQRQRGYNQSDALARAALKVIGARAPEWRLEYRPDVMERRRQTATQAGLNPRGRRRNLQGAFAVRRPELVDGAEVLVIDDIYTTGTTARECARVLRRAGAAKVWVATLARAQKPQVALWDGGQGERKGFG